MGTPSLLAGVLVALLASAAFFGVAARLRHRPVSRASRAALELLRGWWIAVGVYGILQGALMPVLALAGVQDVRVYVTVRAVSLLVLLVGLWSLTSYFAFLFTGTLRALRPIALLFGLVYALATFTLASGRAVGIDVGEWVVSLRYEPAPEPGLVVFTYLAVTLPVVVASLLYLHLARGVQDPRARSRARLVAGALLLWVLSALGANLAQEELLQFLTRPVLGLAAAAIVLVAYREPIAVAAPEPEAVG